MAKILYYIQVNRKLCAFQKFGVSTFFNVFELMPHWFDLKTKQNKTKQNREIILKFKITVFCLNICTPE